MFFENLAEMPQAYLVRSLLNARSNAAGLRNSVFLLRNWCDSGKR
jgi:hypothetical protein